METDKFVTENFPPQIRRKLKSEENKIRDFLSSVLYLIKQLFHSRLLDMSLW